MVNPLVGRDGIPSHELISGYSLDDFTLWIHYFDLDRHLTDRVCRARQARIMRTNSCFHTIEHSFLDFATNDIGLGNAVNGFAHRPVIVTSGDDEVDRSELAGLIRFVVMDERTTRRFENTDAFALVILPGVEDVGAEDIGIIQQFADAFDTVNNFDHASVVEVKGLPDGIAVIESLEDL